MVRNPERRNVLTDAAIEVLAKRGARGLTFRAVDTVADVPGGTASNYFANRDELLHEVGRRIHLRLQPAAGESAVADLASSEEAVPTLLREIFSRIVEDRSGYLALMELRLEATRNPSLRALLTETVRSNHERDVRVYQEAGLPGDRTTVLLLYLAVNGLAVEHLTLPDMMAARGPEDVIDDLVTRVVAR